MVKLDSFRRIALHGEWLALGSAFFVERLKNAVVSIDLTDCCCNTENELFVVPVCISIFLTRIKLYVLSDQFPHKFGYWVLCVIPSQQPLAGVPRK